MKNFLSILTLAAVTALLVTSCKPGEDNTGRIFMPDMHYSNAYEAYSSTKFQYNSDTDAISAMKPVIGAIPRGYLADNAGNSNAGTMTAMFKDYFPNPLEHRNLDDAAERARAGAMLQNPYARTDEVMSEGKELYNIYCAVCHGTEGAGNGSIVELANGDDGPYTSRPPHYNTRLPGMSDGEIYYSISYGKNMMGGYYSQVNAEDRWKLVHYVKELGGIAEDPAAAAALAAAAAEGYDNMAANGDMDLLNADGLEGGAASQEVFSLESVTAEAGKSFNVPDIYFTTGSASLLSASHPILDEVAAFFQSNKNVLVEIGSHADARGDATANLQLSQARAKAVVDYLVTHGVKNKQVVPVGYGSTQPAIDCNPCTEEQYEQNRRTTFKILEVN